MSDPRFARLKSDPRFRPQKRHQSKVLVDDRFRGIFQEGNKNGKKHGKSGSLVDKYGRQISATRETDNLRRFYRLQKEGEDISGAEPKLATDYARGEVLLESSDDENEPLSPGDEGSDPDVVTLGHDSSRPITVEDDDGIIDLDESIFADLDAQATAYAKSHPPTEEIGDRTRRLAVVNLDWDHVRAAHLYKIFSSLVSPTAPVSGSFSDPMSSDRQASIGGSKTSVVKGKVFSVRVYTSDFGKERLAKEEKEGPPAEVFKKRQDVEEEVDKSNIYKLGEEDDYDENALRKYQLERLRYYYAIATFDTVEAASHIYSELDGTELERSANVFDLSFVPDEMTFDDEFRDEAMENTIPHYKGVDFVTDALRHSKVKLTWDEDDPQRNQVTRRALTNQEIEDADFNAYLASSTSGSESDAGEQSASKITKNKKASSRDALRALLLGGKDDELPEGWGRGRDDDKGRDVDMEITFTTGLSETKGGDTEETTLDIYQRKRKEKRKKRKQDAKEKVTKKSDVKDDFFTTESGDEVETNFQVGPSLKDNGNKQRRTSKDRNALPVPSSRTSSTPGEVALPVASESPNAEPQHFNLKSVLKAEKNPKGKRRKWKKNAEDDNEIQEDFVIDVKDDRFKALHENHTFAIDPSNPRFKRTKGMAALLDERSRRRNTIRRDGEDSAKADGNGEQSLKHLVESVKRKSFVEVGTGKRRKF